MPIAPQTRLDRYEIVALLGTGGMGEVYLARDTRLERQVALKLLPAAVAADAERMRRFADEARTASALNHPNILTIYEAGESGGIHFIATEFVDGVTLREQMSRARLDVAAALDVAAQVASALGAAHTAGIVHRDIKPENVMVRSDGVVKVLDFGLAKLLEADRPRDGDGPTRTASTGAGLVMGTVKYMSPEQARGIPVDARSDIFSLGALLYEMLAGQPPFDGETPSDVIAAVLKTEPPSLEHEAPGASREPQHIVAKALRKDRELRYQSVKDLLIDLKDLRQDLEFQARLGAAAAIERGAEPKQEPRVKDSTHEKPALWITRRWRAAAIGVTALALVLVAVFSRVNRAVALTEKDTSGSDRSAKGIRPPRSRTALLYTFSSGGKGSQAILSAVDARSGKIHWQERSIEKATFVWADQKLITLDQDGNLMIAHPSPEGFKIAAKAAVLQHLSWTPPALVGTRLYIRDRRNMMAVELG